MTRKANQRNKLGSEVANQAQYPQTDADVEDNYLAKKRQKQVSKKLLHLQTTRMLEILNHRAGESDQKRLEYSLKSMNHGQAAATRRTSRSDSMLNEIEELYHQGSNS